MIDIAGGDAGNSPTGVDDNCFCTNEEARRGEMAKFCKLDKLEENGRVWQKPVEYGIILHSLVEFVRILQNMAKFGKIFSLTLEFD